MFLLLNVCVCVSSLEQPVTRWTLLWYISASFFFFFFWFNLCCPVAFRGLQQWRWKHNRGLLYQVRLGGGGEMQLQPHLKNESLRGFQLQQSTMKTWENTHTATHTHATFSPDTHSWAGMHVIHRLSWALELKPRHSRDGEQLLDRSCSSLCSLFFFFFFFAV